jgi:hypothetical protein
MTLMDRALLRALRSRLGKDTEFLAVDHGVSDALGVEHKVTAVLTEQSLILATGVRAETKLRTIPRADIWLIEPLETNYVSINYADDSKGIRRVVKLDLRKSGDRAGLLAQLAPGGEVAGEVAGEVDGEAGGGDGT